MSVNVSKQKRDDLIAHLQEIRCFIDSVAQDENAENLRKYLVDLEKEIKGKKYGLVFEKHREAIDEILTTHTPVLTEDQDLLINNGGLVNFLIEGDNLAALKLLEKTHREKIDLIYIDPPYNTGNKDFVYDDDYVDKLDGYRHSKWLSFLSERLILARNLLNSKGLILISINDIELYQLKILCDQIFGESNFLANFIWQSTPGSNTGLDIKTVTEYVLCYAKKKEHCAVSSIPADNEDTYRFEDKYLEERGRYKLNQLDRRMTGPHYSDALNYSIPMPDGTLLFPGGTETKQANWNWRWSSESVQKGITNGFIEFKKNKGKWKVYFKQYYRVNNKNKPIERSLPYQNLIGKLDGANSARGTQEVMDLLGAKVFDYPKPLNLLLYLLKIYNGKDASFLDFFAGSGTTGQAVLQLNAEDGGKRRFILCTDNENNICRNVTYERLKRVISKESYSVTLKYYQIDFIPISERLYYEYADKLLTHMRELVELENGVNFTDSTEIAIILTDSELASFVNRPDVMRRSRVLYLSHNVLPSPEQELTLALNKIKVNIIPDYYCRELAR